MLSHPTSLALCQLRPTRWLAVEIAEDIKKANFKLFGATVEPVAPNIFHNFGDQEIEIVPATAAAAIVDPFSMELPVLDQLGSFVANVQDPRTLDLTNPLVFEPFEIDIGQNTPDLTFNHRRAILKPNPYTRVVWLGTSPDFFVGVEPSAATIKRNQSGNIIVSLVPNGVRHQTIPPACPVFVNVVAGVPAGSHGCKTLGRHRAGRDGADPTKVRLQSHRWSRGGGRKLHTQCQW